MEELFKSFAEELEERKLSKAWLKPGQEAQAAPAGKEPHATMGSSKPSSKPAGKDGKDGIDHIVNSDSYRKAIKQNAKIFPRSGDDNHPDHLTMADHVSGDLQEKHSLSDVQREKLQGHVENELKTK